MMITPTTILQRSRDRRGVLLLLVLGGLTLFMMLGALMLVLAIRSRTSARAFAKLATSTDADSVQSRALLDDALMVLLRGSKVTLPTEISESLLSDRYGSATVTGTAVAGTVVPLTAYAQLKGGVILTAQLQGLAPPVAHPCDLNGRVLTFRPDPDDGEIASYRILRTTGAAAPFTVYLANTTASRSVQLPRKACRVVVNGSEFVDEAHDSYDKDFWLARIPLVDSRSGTTGSIRPSFAPGGSAMAINDARCDNDNDGVPDGIWISGGTTSFFPARPSPLGGTLRYRVSYLVLDLDGRVNLNAHGSPVAAMTGTADWLPNSQGVNISDVPVGLGYGPADVDASRLLGSDEIPGVPGYQSSRLTGLMVQGTSAAAPLPLVPIEIGPAVPRRPTPAIGTPVEGRYGRVVSGSVGPGAPGAALPAIAVSGLAGRSPTDLNVRTRAFVRPASAGGVPTLVFYVPDRTQSDFVGDPYEFRLDGDGPRNALVRQPAAKAGTPPADNPFTVSELEPILRPFDVDAPLLPPRLAAVLADAAGQSRMTVTTDTWDTPALAGTAATKVRQYLRQFPAPASPFSDAAVYGAMSPDVTAGLRFDVNRPLEHPSVPAANAENLKQRYCRHLFTLLVALGLPADATTAQWAANVCDFRDPDSTMTVFRYDTNPTDGWATTTASPVVVGAERPEIVISEAVAWAGHASAVLCHPWNAVVTDRTNGTTAVEAVDGPLQGAVANTLLLAKTHDGAVTGSPIWRLRCQGGGAADFNGADVATCTLAPDESICVQTGDPLTSPLGKKLSLPAFVPGGVGPATLVLERLADPTRAADNDAASATYNPYVTVDEASITVAADKNTAQTFERDPASGFWKNTFRPVALAGPRPPDKYPHPAPWFHWPNRPFVSVGELALVPTGSARDMLATYVRPSPTAPFASLAANPAVGLLDAVHVPSRFVGTSQTVGLQPNGGCPLLVTAATTEHVCTTQLPRWREPGRVNVNTIASNTGNASNPELDDGVWKALAGGSAPANPFATGTTGDAADSFTKLIAVDKTPNRPPLADTPAAPRNNNPFFTYGTAIRLANVGTVRSHVFAVWVTLEISDDSPTAPPVTTRRLFAIVDRSIPVGFSPGENLNVRDTVRLQRFLE